MKCYKKFLAAVLLLLPLCGNAMPANEQLAQLLNQVSSLQANFVQTIYDTNGEQLQQSSGQMTLQRPGKFRWQTQSPAKQLLIADGKHLWFYDIDLAQATEQPQTADKNSPALLLSGSTTALTQNFIISQLLTTANQQLFKLLPKTKSALFQKVQLAFHHNTLSKMQMDDNLGQITVIEFAQTKNNPPLDANLFRFTPPKGIDIIKN
jgi:outer membrane lipoprotein carrier protein